MSSEEKSGEVSRASAGSSPVDSTRGQVEPGQKVIKQCQSWEELSPGEAVTPDEASARTGIPVSFFNNTWRDDPDYMATRVIPYQKSEEAT